MSSWNTEITASTHDAGAALSNQMQGRSRDTSTTNGLNFGGYNYNEKTTTSGFLWWKKPETTISGYDMVGIAGGEVNNMRQAVVDYVVKVQASVELAIKNATDGINDAFRGAEAQAAVVAYLEKVKLYITNLISQLESFADKIADVGNAWNAAQQSFGQSVNTATGNFSEGTAYTQQVTYNGNSADLG